MLVTLRKCLDNWRSCIDAPATPATRGRRSQLESHCARYIYAELSKQYSPTGALFLGSDDACTGPSCDHRRHHGRRYGECGHRMRERKVVERISQVTRSLTWARCTTLFVQGAARRVSARAGILGRRARRATEDKVYSQLIDRHKRAIAHLSGRGKTAATGCAEFGLRGWHCHVSPGPRHPSAWSLSATEPAGITFWGRCIRATLSGGFQRSGLACRPVCSPPTSPPTWSLSAHASGGMLVEFDQMAPGAIRPITY